MTFAGTVSSAAVAAGIATTWIAASTRVSTTRVSAAGITSATAMLWKVLVWLFAFEVYGIDDGVGSLGGLDGFDEGFSAPAIATVGEDDDGFAASLLAHKLVGGEEESVI